MTGATPDALKAKFPDLPWYSPETPGYAEIRRTRSMSYTTIDPIAIVEPASAAEVAAIVSYATAAGIRVAVRSGGGDFYGRNMFSDAITIDMRRINFVDVQQDKTTAKIGGGIIVDKLVADLHSNGFMTPFGNVGTIGYVGWATLGGYGPLSSAYGMGFDQIVGAEVINDKGEIVQADEEMLEGIRGMGGNLGVIVSLTIKVYPATDLLTGMIFYESSNIPKTVQRYIESTSRLSLPRPLTLQHFAMKTPDQVMALSWVWASSDHEVGKEFMKKFLEIGPPSVMSTMDIKSAPEWLVQPTVHCASWGGQRSVYLRGFSAKIIEIICNALEKMPAFHGPNVAWTEIRPDNPTAIRENALNACFGTAEPHIVLSFSYMVEKEEHIDAAVAWNKELYEAFRGSGDRALMESSYASLTPPEDRTAEQLYGTRWENVIALKRKYDPTGVFNYAAPAIR